MSDDMLFSNSSSLSGLFGGKLESRIFPWNLIFNGNHLQNPWFPVEAFIFPVKPHIPWNFTPGFGAGLAIRGRLSSAAFAAGSFFGSWEEHDHDSIRKCFFPDLQPGHWGLTHQAHGALTIGMSLQSLARNGVDIAYRQGTSFLYQRWMTS